MSKSPVKWWKAALLELERRWCRFRGRPVRLKITYFNNLPGELASDLIYVVEEDESLWFAAFLCPCGCQEIIQLNLETDVRPCWYLTVHENGTPTFKPSVWRVRGCKSHFFVRHGLIDWV
jgi:hypothetical protein